MLRRNKQRGDAMRGVRESYPSKQPCQADRQEAKSAQSVRLGLLRLLPKHWPKFVRMLLGLTYIRHDPLFEQKRNFASICKIAARSICWTEWLQPWPPSLRELRTSPPRIN